ncbi:hypothetical protein L2681_03750 [Lactobacillus gasseri]|nr:hypothetical protein [Lactobacillus gasseri]MCZ3574115.1 hypothetical protein [Lactobacillus gasseri]MCZ3671113.1 hypothetical protein [Lactobacillus gasseri]MCZ3673530.1 hypothetical protein [Lactobacillus gasseri]MCZ3676452.1 hypothetical protein [Lactobacillus gasseri]
MQTISYYNSPIGKILLASDEQGLVGLWLDTDRYYGDILAKNYSEGENKYLSSAKKWLNIFFKEKSLILFLNCTLLVLISRKEFGKHC